MDDFYYIEEKLSFLLIACSSFNKIAAGIMQD